MSGDVSDEHPSVVPALEREQKTPNKLERYATCKTRPESTNWTMSGSKSKGSFPTVHKGHKQSTVGRTLPTGPGGQNQQDRKLLQAKREVKPKPQKVLSVPGRSQCASNLPHNGRQVKPKVQKSATVPPYRARSNVSPVPPPKLNYTRRNEAQRHGSPKQGSKS